MPSKSMANRNSVIFLKVFFSHNVLSVHFSLQNFCLFIMVLNIVFMDFLCAQMHVSLNLYVFFVLFLWLFFKTLFGPILICLFFFSYFILFLMPLKRKKGVWVWVGGEVGKVWEELGKDKLFSEYIV